MHPRPEPRRFGITGATGAVGGGVARRLAEEAAPLRLVVRDESRAPRLPGAEIAVVEGYADKATMTRALDGVETLFLVSGHESPDRAAHHASAVDAATAAGVRRVVYTSFLGAAPDATFTFARQHHETEQHIRASGLDFTFLRNSMYLEYMGAVASADGVIAGPAADGRFAPVSRADVIDVAVAVLTGKGHGGRTYDVTGPRLYSFHDVVAELSKVSGRDVVYHVETLQEAYASRAPYGAPKSEVDGWVTSYLAIARGELEVVADTVDRLTGRAPQTLPEFLAAHPETWTHLTS